MGGRVELGGQYQKALVVAVGADPDVAVEGEVADDWVLADFFNASLAEATPEKRAHATSQAVRDGARVTGPV